MNRCEQIKAYHQREERYQGLLLEYDGSSVLKDEIYEFIEDVTLEIGLIPKLYQNSHDSIYIEFHDEYDRKGGVFFTTLLGKLGIDKCEA